MTTSEAFIIHDGYYNEEDEMEDTMVTFSDDDWVSFKPNLSGCEVADLLKLVAWISGDGECK